MLIIDFINFCFNMYSGVDVDKSVNLQINVIFAGAFHPYS